MVGSVKLGTETMEWTVLFHRMTFGHPRERIWITSIKLFLQVLKRYQLMIELELPAQVFLHIDIQRNIYLVSARSLSRYLFQDVQT